MNSRVLVSAAWSVIASLVLCASAERRAAVAPQPYLEPRPDRVSVWRRYLDGSSPGRRRQALDLDRRGERGTLFLARRLAGSVFSAGTRKLPMYTSSAATAACRGASPGSPPAAWSPVGRRTARMCCSPPGTPASRFTPGCFKFARTASDPRRCCRCPASIGAASRATAVRSRTCRCANGRRLEALSRRPDLAGVAGEHEDARS